MEDRIFTLYNCAVTLCDVKPQLFSSKTIISGVFTFRDSLLMNYPACNSYEIALNYVSMKYYFYKCSQSNKSWGADKKLATT